MKLSIILYITRLIILILSTEISLKNDFGIKGLIHYNQNNGNIFLKMIPIGHFRVCSKIICLS